MRKFIIASITMVTLTFGTAIGQNYNSAIGVRLGGLASGISLKHFVSGNGALEGLLSFHSHTFIITGLYESYHAFPNAEGLAWFWGGGAHIGFYGTDYRYGGWYYDKHHHKVLEVDDDYDSSVSFGGDFIIGLDYKFKNAPVNLSLDVKPMIDLIPGVYGYWEGGLGIRFTF
jgi:hypothetical protein